MDRIVYFRFEVRRQSSKAPEAFVNDSGHGSRYTDIEWRECIGCLKL